MERCTEYPIYKNKIVFQLTLHSVSMMVTQTYKAQDINPHWAQEWHTQRTQTVNILAGNIGNKVIGLFVIDGTRNGARYLEL